MILESISRYLQLGGLFNPELMDHAKVRDMIIACRDRIEALEAERDEYRRFATHWHSQCQAVATVLSLPEPEGTNHAECVRSAFEAAEAREARLSEALRPFAAITEVPALGSITVDMVRDARAALSGSGSGWLADLRAKWPIGAQFRIEHDGFVGTVRGYYERDDGYRGIVGQIDSKTGAKIVHVYGEKWPLPAAPQQGGE